MAKELRVRRRYSSEIDSKGEWRESGWQQGYSDEHYRFNPENTSRALGAEVHISPKHARELSSAIRGMDLEDAKRYLEDVIALKQPVPFRRYKRYVGHRKGKGFGPGRYPKKAAKAIMEVLENAEANAESKMLETDTMFIAHIAAYSGRIYKATRPRARGRATAWNTDTANIEVVLKEKEELEE